MFVSLLQDAQDAFLEQERDRVLTRKIVTIQKAIRGWTYRLKFQKMKTCCVTLQAALRSYIQHKKYIAVSEQDCGTFLEAFHILCSIILLLDARWIPPTASSVPLANFDTSIHAPAREDDESAGN